MEKLTKTNSAIEYECEKYIAPELKNADFLTRVQGDSMGNKKPLHSAHVGNVGVRIYFISVTDLVTNYILI